MWSGWRSGPCAEHAIVQGEGGVGVDFEEKKLVVVLDAMQMLPTRSSLALHTTSHPFAAKVGHMKALLRKKSSNKATVKS